MRDRDRAPQWKADVGALLQKTLSSAPPVKAALVVVTAILGIQHLRERARRKNAPRRLQRVTNSFRAPDDAAGDDVPEVEWVDLSLGALQPMLPPPLALELEVLKHAFRCDPASLLRFLCHPDSPFLRQRSNALRYENVAPGPWRYQTDATGKRVRARELYYEVPVSSSFGPSHANVTETQALDTFPWGFVLHVHARNPNVPFGKRFFTQLQYVCWRLDADSCCLLITAQVVFTGSAGMLRGVIAASTRAGLQDSYAAMLQLMCAAFESVPLPPDTDASLHAAVEAGAAIPPAVHELPALTAEARRSKEAISVPPSPLAPPSTLTSPTTAILVALCAAVLVFVVCYALVPALLPDLQHLLGCAQDWLVRAQMPLRSFAGVPSYAAPPRRWW